MGIKKIEKKQNTMGSEKTEKIETLMDLIRSLATLYIDLKEGIIDVPTAVEMNNSAGKIINAAKLQLEYEGMVKQGLVNITFLNQRSQSPKEITSGE